METNAKRYTQRKRRVRAKMLNNIKRPRLSIFRSNKYIYAQIIDDIKMITLASAKGEDPKKVGEEIAKKAIKLKIKNVVFDRGAFRYHGRVKAVALAAREGGLNF